MTSLSHGQHIQGDDKTSHSTIQTSRHHFGREELKVTADSEPPLRL